MVLADPLYCALWRYVEVRYKYRHYKVHSSFEEDMPLHELQVELDLCSQEIRALLNPSNHVFRSDALNYVIGCYDQWVAADKPPLLHLDVLIINRLSHE